MVMVKSIPEGVQAVFPMLVCQSPEAEMNFCAAVFGAVEQVRRPGPDGSPIHIAMRINDAFLVETTEGQRSERWSEIAEERQSD
jgi:PhnB protein